MTTPKVGHSRQARARKLYVLIRTDQESSRVVNLFLSAFEAEQYGKRRGFVAAIGPFRTRFAAELMADFGQGNPHFQHVDDAEAYAKKYLALADDAIKAESVDAFDVAADCGQMFGNVKHMTWFRERLAYQLFCNA